MTNVKNVLKLSEQELRSNMKTSWHDQYKNSAWIFVGGLPYELTEGDVICVFSQYGEIVNLSLARDKGTGKSRGFCFICYEDQKSTNLAVDNLNGIKIRNRTIRVDHCENYKAPKDDKMDDESRQLHAEGCAPGSKFGKMPQLPSSGSNGGLDKGLNLPPMESLLRVKTETESSPKKLKNKKEKKEKKEKTSKNDVKKIFKKKKKDSSSSSSSEDSSSDSEDSRSKRKRGSKKLKRKQESSTSSSDESENENKKKRSEKSSNMKSQNAKQRKTGKYSSSESESDIENEIRTSRNKNELNERSRSKDDHKQNYQSVSRNFSKPDTSDRRVKDDKQRSYGEYRDEGKAKSFSQRSYRDNEKGRSDVTHGGDRDKTEKNRDDSRRYGTDRASRDDRSTKYFGDSREDAYRYDNERKWKGDRGEIEHYRKKDGRHAH